MALRDQPYLPLYVQDLLTDEKLVECSAAAHGVYLLLLCILHKQEKYGLLCLKQKYKQNDEQIKNFALMLCKQMPFEAETIANALTELVAENVLRMEDDHLFQKRMVRDGELSVTRTEAGKKGGNNVTKQYGKPGFLYLMSDGFSKTKVGVSVNPQNRLYRLRSDLALPRYFEIKNQVPVGDMGRSEDAAHAFFGGAMNGEWVTGNFTEIANKFVLLEANLLAKGEANSEANTLAKTQANAENAIENENEDHSFESLKTFLVPAMQKIYTDKNPGYLTDKKNDYPAIFSISQKIQKLLSLPEPAEHPESVEKVKTRWGEIIDFANSDRHFANYTISQIDKHLQAVLKAFSNSIKNPITTTNSAVAEKIQKAQMAGASLERQKDY